MTTSTMSLSELRLAYEKAAEKVAKIEIDIAECRAYGKQPPSYMYEPAKAASDKSKKLHARVTQEYQRRGAVPDCCGEPARYCFVYAKKACGDREVWRCQKCKNLVDREAIV